MSCARARRGDEDRPAAAEPGADGAALDPRPPSISPGTADLWRQLADACARPWAYDEADPRCEVSAA